MFIEMLRMNKDNTDYEIDREVTWKWTIEKNAELQDMLEQLKKEHRRMEKDYKALQVEHSRILFDIDAVIEWEVKKKYKKLTEKCKNLETRIDVMQELIDYNEWIVNNAIRMADYEWWLDKAIDYLEKSYAVGDDAMYEAMERADEEDSDLFD